MPRQSWWVRKMNDRDAVRKELGSRGVGRSLTGGEFRDVRSRCGYSAREFAIYLKEINAPITTARSVYRLETLRIVPPRYGDTLLVFVGEDNFRSMLQEMEREAEENRLWREQQRARYGGNRQQGGNGL